MHLFKAEVRGEAGLQVARNSGPGQASFDLEVREFRSSESDWRARARISHKIQFDAIAKHNKTI